MGILGFGGAAKLEDLKTSDLKKERLTQEVKQDQLLVRLRHAQEQHDSLLEVASEPGLSDAEVDVAAYKMSQISKARNRSEQELQQALTRMTVIDSTLDIINQRQELQQKGIWKKINEIPEEEMESQLEDLAVERKESQINLNRIVVMFDVDRQSVQSQCSPGCRRSREANMTSRQQKSD